MKLSVHQATVSGGYGIACRLHNAFLPDYATTGEAQKETPPM